MELLVANGHRLEDVWGYSLRAIQAYADSIHKRRRDQLADLAQAIRTAHHAEPKIFEQFLDGLGGD